MKKKWIALLVSSLHLVVCSGQFLITSDSVLASARQDPALKAYDQQMTYRQQSNLNLPFVDQISLRTETDRFDISRQEYLARVSVNGFNEIHQQRLLQESTTSTKGGMQRVYWHEALLERYEVVAAYRQVQRELVSYHKLQQVYADKVNVLKKMAVYSVDTDVEELIETEFDLDNLLLKIAESEALIEQLHQTIQLLNPMDSMDWQLDTSAYITPAQIEVVITGLPQTVFQNPELIEKQAKIDQITAEYNYERAKSNQVLDFFQVRYANLPFAQLEREFSIGIGLNLPFRGTSRVNMSELSIDKNEEGQNMQLYMAELDRQVSNGRSQIVALGRHFRLAHQQWQDSQARYTLEHPANAQADGPMILLNARELQLKREQNVLEIEREMMELYLKILDWTGQLSEQPAINYLSKELSAY